MLKQNASYTSLKIPFSSFVKLVQPMFLFPSANPPISFDSSSVVSQSSSTNFSNHAFLHCSFESLNTGCSIQSAQLKICSPFWIEISCMFCGSCWLLSSFHHPLTWLWSFRNVIEESLFQFDWFCKPYGLLKAQPRWTFEYSEVGQITRITFMISFGWFWTWTDGLISDRKCSPSALGSLLTYSSWFFWCCSCSAWGWWVQIWAYSTFYPFWY